MVLKTGIGWKPGGTNFTTEFFAVVNNSTTGLTGTFGFEEEKNNRNYQMIKTKTVLEIT